MLNVIWGLELVWNFLPIAASKGYGKTGLRFPVIRDHGGLTRRSPVGCPRPYPSRYGTVSAGNLSASEVAGSALPPPFHFPPRPPTPPSRPTPSGRPPARRPRTRSPSRGCPP